MRLAHKLLKDKNILIVDSDINTVFLIKELLKTFEANFISVSSSIEVKDIIMRRCKIHLIILDVFLRDGIQGTDFIKQLKIAYPLAPLIIQTALSSFEIQQNSLNSGCDAFILKPYSGKGFVNSVEELMLQK